MIIKIHKAGRSFKGVCAYLGHDVKAETKERVAWTHTFNLTHDDVDSAVHEMLWTFRAADHLKREAGIATGGSKLERPVRHFSLSWAHGESPGQNHMTGTVRAYMAHMGWADRQAILFAHRDKQHHHVHVVMNSVNPTDGRSVRSSHDWRRTESFGLAYEREHGKIHCEQRLKKREERDPTPTREKWMDFKKSETEFNRQETERLTAAPGYFERQEAASWKDKERGALKAYLQKQREEFFMRGRAAYRGARNEAFREIREEFRPQWNAYYAAARSGQDKASLVAVKQQIMHAQKAALDERRKAACDELRKQRDVQYEGILAQQRFDRAELARRQQQGLRTYALLDVFSPQPAELARSPERPRGQDGREVNWRTASRMSEADRDVAREFERTGQSAIHPPGGVAPERGMVEPGVVRRSPIEPAAVTSDNFGREHANLDTPQKEKVRDAAQRTGAPASRDEVMGVPAAKAREMNDERRTKDERTEAAALRASWNRHSRWRGGRD